MAERSRRSTAGGIPDQLEHIELQQQGSPSSDTRPTEESDRVPDPSRQHTAPPTSSYATDGHEISRARRARPPPPELQVRTDLDAIESHLPVPSSSPGRRHGKSVRLGSKTRPLDEPQHGYKASMASAKDNDATLTYCRKWVSQQRIRQRRWTSKSWARAQAIAEMVYKRYILEGLLRQKPIPPSKDGRHIPLKPGLARRKPLVDERTGRAYVPNFIRSSRYTLWDFLPKQLFFQFSKLANFYFLVIGILQMIPGLSTTGTYTTIGPLIAFVALSMAKEGYDDYRRYRLDKLENRSSAWVLDPEATVKNRPRRERAKSHGLFGKEKQAVGGDPQLADLEAVRSGLGEPARWARVEWQDVRVGDIIQLQRDENVPADIVLLHATGPNNIAYIETMALDGETNLKSKQACPLLAKHCSTIAGIEACDAEIVSEDPNIDLYNFEGRVTVRGKTMPLTLNEVVYRGSTLRNTAEAIGLVINSGEECKIRMNANKNVRAKAPEMQYAVNRIVILLVFFVIALSVGCTGGYIIWRGDYESRAWYLNRGSVSLGHIFIAFVIAYNTLIPLSLYVSLEIVKLGQLYLLNDLEMYDPVTDTPMVANTSTILENLGQVGYVFSDKTGTLTENIMKFRRMSVAGTAWLHDMDLQNEMGKRATHGNQKRQMEKGFWSSPSKVSKRLADPEVMEEPLVEGYRSGIAYPAVTSPAPRWNSPAHLTHNQLELKTDDLLRYISSRPDSPFSRKVRQFILCLALCHTCLPETKEGGEISFQAASPDELALVEAAKDLGFLLVDRAAQSMTLQIRTATGTTTTETYEILDVIEFSSKRKRMSIIIRMPDRKLCIFTKGADSVILPRLRQKEIAMQTVSAVERRASMRRSAEQEKALLRRSLQSPTRDSMNLMRSPSTLDRRNSWRRSSTIPSAVETWLSRRETGGFEDESTGDGAYSGPRRSFGATRSLELARLADPLDSLVDEALILNEAAVFERCFEQVDNFATEGLRTLIFAYRFLDEQDYQNWKAIYHEATTSLVKRQERIEEAAELIERDFDLAGATAIEDKLQQGVPETIDKLRRANIKVWMLTGDKRETAINIAHSARICKPFSEVYILDVTQGDLQERLVSTLTEVGRGMVPHSVAVIDGHTLSVVEDNEALRQLFFDLVARVDSVICCRASPSQKANLVRCIRRQAPKAVTLAIGDGANDIAMIQASHVGIGISGREGLQAARISDYSIAQFRFLQRLLFVHGRWNYIRSGKYILGTFWKEVVFYLIQAHYQRYNGYTGTSIFESASLTVFNSIFTSLPVIIPGIFERDLSAATLMAVPELYTFGQRNKGFNFVQYLGWMAVAVAESAIIYYSVHYIYATASHFPVETDLFAVGQLAYSCAVVLINLKLMFLEVRDRTIIMLGAMAVSLAAWFLWNVVLSAVYSRSPGPYVVRDAFLYGFGREGMWWLVNFVVVSATVVFELGVTAVRKSLWPTDTDLMQEMESMKGVMEVLRDHAVASGGETGGGGAVGECGGVGNGDGSGVGVSKGMVGDAASVKTATTMSASAATAASPTQWEGCHPHRHHHHHHHHQYRPSYHGHGNGHGQSAGGVSSNGPGRLTGEFVRPQFTPPPEERENPMERIETGIGSEKEERDRR